MILHRDAIVGQWQGVKFNGALFPADTATNLERWEAWVRGATLDFELLSHLHFTWGDETVPAPTPKQPKKTRKAKTAMLWHVDTGALTAAGPQLKPKPLAGMIAPTRTIFEQQLRYLDGYADLREDRAAEIVAQMGPPLAFWSSVMHLHPSRHRWTIELIETALRLATYVEMRFKHALACRRPVDFSPQVQPLILTPGHGTLPSGHSTEAHLIAALLVRLGASPGAGKGDRAWREQLMRQAARIAVNRTVAGVHFPVDSAAGQMLGLTLADYIDARRRANGSVAAWRFDGERYDPAADFTGRELYDTSNGNRLERDWAYISKPAQPVERSPMLEWLWNKARAEWR
jgi:hypothetical protein